MNRLRVKCAVLLSFPNNKKDRMSSASVLPSALRVKHFIVRKNSSLI